VRDKRLLSRGKKPSSIFLRKEGSEPDLKEQDREVPPLKDHTRKDWQRKLPSLEDVEIAPSLQGWSERTIL
jgi:hypothetical protein